MAVLTRGLSELFEEFLRGFEDKDGERKYQVLLAQLAASGSKSVIVDYEDLIHFNTDLAESLLKDPDRALRECKAAAFEVLSTENPGYASEIKKGLTVRLRGVTDRVNLRKVDTSHLDKMIAFAGMLVRTSELRPLLVDAAFVCPDGHTTRVVQEGPSIKKPAKCEGCDETRNFELDQKDSTFIDSQILRVQELPEELPPGQLPRFFDIDVEGDIVNTARPGDRAIMTGIVRAEPDFSFGIPRSRSFRSKIDANYIEVVGKEPSQIHITKEDEAIIKSIAAGQDAYPKLIKSMAPGILGHDAVKEAILLLLVGGPQTVLPDGTKLRGDINVFLVGDPGVAKSEMLKFAAQVAPRGMFASGRGSTAAGLSAAVIREKNTLMLEAGVVVLADQGIACLHPNTNIIFDNDIVKIGDLASRVVFEKARSGKDEVEVALLQGSVNSLDLNSLSVKRTDSTVLRRKMFKGNLKVFRLKSGNSIMLTPDHLLLEGDSITWTRAQEFAVGEHVVAPLRLPSSNTDTYIWDILPDDAKPTLDFEERVELTALIRERFGTLSAASRELEIPLVKKSNYANLRLGQLKKIVRALNVENKWRGRCLKYWNTRLKTPVITPEMAYLVGFVFGDGHVANRSDGGLAISMLQADCHVSYMNRFIEFWRRSFDSSVGTVRSKSSAMIRGKRVTSSGQTVNIGKRIFEAIYKYLTEQNLQHCLRLSDSSIAGFVSGLIDSDGCLSEKTCNKNGRSFSTWEIVFAVSNQEQTNLNLGLLLRRFGCLAFVHDTRQNVFHVSISSRRDCKLLQEKTSRLSVKMSKEVPERKANMPGVSELLPKRIVGDLIRNGYRDVPRAPLLKAGVWSTIYSYMHETRNPRMGQIQKLLDRTGDMLEKDCVQSLSTLICGNYFLDQITAISDVPYEGYVYDLYVPGQHNYIADGIIVENCIDEFDKMKPEDRSALHEQMEQQSYHPSTEVLLSSGKVKIGDFVEEAIRSHPERVEQGKDCQIARVSLPDRIFSVDFGDGRVEKTSLANLSRHRAPTRFIKVNFSNGRSILVTPEHPIFTFSGAGMSTIRAERLRPGAFVPGPTFVPNSSKPVVLEPVMRSKRSKEVVQPGTLTIKIARILGYLVTEGNFYVGSSVEVDFANLDERLLKEMRVLMRGEFGLEPTIRISEGRWAGLRYVSTTFHAWLTENFPEMMCKARSKRAPAKIIGASVAHVNEFLTSAFLGDGGVETDAVCYRTASRGLAEDYQDLLLKLAIASRIVTDSSNDSFKVYIRGDSLGDFLERVVDRRDHRRGKIQELVDRGKRNNRSHDVLPTSVGRMLIQLLDDAGLSYNGYFSQHIKRGNGITKSTVHRYLGLVEERRQEVMSALEGKSPVRQLRESVGWSQERLAYECGVKRRTIEYAERGGYGSRQVEELTTRVRGAISKRLAAVGESARFITNLMGLRFLRVTGVESVANSGAVATDWVYDVTVEPRHNFVSAGVVLHNTITIAKGGIYATLNARTAILAATNPILGKYDPYQNLIDNINLPIPLLTRFDLIFVLRDTPSPSQDEKLATHILDVHRKRAYVESPPIQFELLKKYVAHAKNYSPVLSMEAENRIKEYYLQLRRSVSEGQIGATPRTLESLIRLASAKARLMLREVVTEEDALTAVSLMNKMVEDVLTDAETKTKGDFGILLGQPAGERGKLATLMDTLRALEGPERKPIEAKVFKQELMRTNKFANEDEVDKLIQKITKEGIIFESKPGFYRRVQG
jgi:DNA replicative helicase MCM subunit Mcm2 (Cdc46/Mcm family)/intein/homing endonuclease